MVQQTAIEIVAVPLPFYDAFNGLSDVLFHAGGLGIQLTPLFNNCFVESNPIPAKAAMAAMGLIHNELRLPLVPAQQSTYNLMVETVKELGL